MKAYQVTLLVIDHDEIGAEGITYALEHTKYPNRRIAPDVKSIRGVDIGEWDDGHPLNVTATADAEYARLFAADPAPDKAGVRLDWLKELALSLEDSAQTIDSEFEHGWAVACKYAAARMRDIVSGEYE